MIERILEIKSQTSFDFRQFANPNDELKDLFDEWVDYYRLKYSICKAVNPKSILEVGVRYGYSAITFLEACSDASYLGIDSDQDTFGGSKGAITWAQKITNGHNADFCIASTQEMSRFPGDLYDFIHIDGQQDGDGTFHDLELAIRQGRFILIDGYFWSGENMLSSTFFLKKYKEFIEYAVVIPGYAGDLLIKTKEANKPATVQGYSYDALEKKYDQNYYLTDCGGYDTFIKSQGRELDTRLAAVFNLVNPQPGEKILDIGCGRGELSYALFRNNAIVTGVDYSEDAIGIAAKTFREFIGNNLQFIKGDVLKLKTENRYHKAVASDIIEHLEKEALDEMLKIMSESVLTEDGLLIIHTAPNKLNYQYIYKQKRRLADMADLYLPINPRTYFEDLFHINEQTPATLNKSLQKHFKHTLIWVATLPDFGGSLLKKFSKDDYAKAQSIFAIASNKPIERNAIISLMTQQKLKNQQLDFRLETDVANLTINRLQQKQLPVVVNNNCGEKMSSLEPFPIHLSYHWLSLNRSVEIFEGFRTALGFNLPQGSKRLVMLNLQAPPEPGRYILQVTIVQEGCFWMESINSELPIEINVEVL